MLSVRARSATSLACAALSCLSPLTSAPLMGEHPPSARAARRATAKALRATGLSFRVGRLHVGTDLELGLEQRLGTVAQHFRRAAGRCRNGDVVGHDDSLQARNVSQELSDLIVLADDGHVVFVSVEGCWT